MDNEELSKLEKNKNIQEVLEKAYTKLINECDINISSVKRKLNIKKHFKSIIRKALSRNIMKALIIIGVLTIGTLSAEFINLIATADLIPAIVSYTVLILGAYGISTIGETKEIRSIYKKYTIEELEKDLEYLINKKQKYNTKLNEAKNSISKLEEAIEALIKDEKTFDETITPSQDIFKQEEQVVDYLGEVTPSEEEPKTKIRKRTIW